MPVDIHGRLNALMSQAGLNNMYRHAGRKQEAGVGVAKVVETHPEAAAVGYGAEGHRKCARTNLHTIEASAHLSIRASPSGP